MNQKILEEKVLNLQTQLDVIKQAVLGKPDFDIDERNWRKTRPEVKKTRKKLYTRYYEEK